MLWIKMFSQMSIGLILLLSAAGGGVYYVFKFDKGGNIKTEIEGLEDKQTKIEQEISDLNIRLKQLNEMDKAMNTMSAEVNQLLQLIPYEMTTQIIVNHLDTQARRAGVDLTDMNSQTSIEKKEFYEKVKVSVTVKGLFRQILMFLSNLTKLSEMITVEKFTLTRGASSQGSYQGGVSEVQMQMDIYGYKYISSSN